MNDQWYSSLYTGIFREFGPIPPRPHDPDVAICAGRIGSGLTAERDLAVGGAGWTASSAEAACVGEAVERLLVERGARDQMVTTSYSAWPLAEPAIAPDRWVLFHPEQYAQPDFPFRPFTSETVCDWVAYRELPSGRACWVPDEFHLLFRHAGEPHRIGPSLSTGLACGPTADEALLRGLQEVIERDAFVGAWWGSYSPERYEPEAVFAMLGEPLQRRVRRPNLEYRFFRIATPYSAHTTIVTLEGEDREGYCFSIGAACRESRVASWQKSLLEAIQGRHYVRYLKTRLGQPDGPRLNQMTDFADHAVYYSEYPERLRETVLARADPVESANPVEPAGVLGDTSSENARVLMERLGMDRPVLFRNVTPSSIAEQISGWVVVRVLVPGLQPLHGNHHLPFLGGSLWAPRGLAEWGRSPPHPFP